MGVAQTLNRAGGSYYDSPALVEGAADFKTLMKFAYYQTFLPQWVEKNSEADFFFNFLNLIIEMHPKA